MLHVQNLTKKFGGLTAVDNVSFHLKPGEIFSLIGPNGSGKTTLVKLICGLLQPTAGQILVGAYDTVKQPLEAKKMIGYIPDEPALWPSMTGFEFLHFTGALYGMEEPARQEAIPKALALFNLSGIEHSPFEDYSRGNRQKFAIAAALLHTPRLLVIDEPIVGLDPASADIAKQKFKDFAASGGSVLMVTHTLSVAQEISHRIGVLRTGALVAEGTMDELRNTAKLSHTATLRDIYQALAQ